VSELGSAEGATRRLSAAQREAADPVLAQARVMRTLEGDVRNYTRVLGDAHPATQALTSRLKEIQSAQVTSGQQTMTLHGQLGQLVSQLSKGESAASGFKGAMGTLASVAGTAGLIALGAAVVNVTQQLAGMAQAALTSGLAGNASMEQYQVTFKVLLSSAFAARQRLQELTQFANTTPFNLPEIVQADKVLQTFGGTALATGNNLRLVGDIASGTGRSFSDVALWVGRTYDALQSGRPWGEAAMRLQEMGALSGTARARLEELQAKGATGTEVWNAFNQEMAKFNGLMGEQSQTAAGLASTLQDLQDQFLRTATRPVFDDLKSFLQVATSEQGIKGMNDSAKDLAATLGVAVPLAVAGLYAGLKPLIDGLLGAGQTIRWLDDTFGLFGHTLGDNAKTATAAIVDMRQGTVHAFSDIGDAAREQQSGLDAFSSQVVRNANEAAAALQRMSDTRHRLSNEGGATDRQRDAVSSMGVQPPPGFSSWSEYSQWNAAHNQIIDQTTAAQGQAELSRQQASNQQYLTAQMAAQNAQAQAQAAVDRLKLSDQTFLQGQASSQITSTQIQTAVDRVKLGNAQLMDASIQADAAQLQVQASITRIRGTNSLLLAATVEADTATTQAGTALSRARAGSKEWVAAQVQAETAQRDAQDALDKARVSAGLIDPTETAAYQRARKHMITPAELIKTEIEDTYSIIKTGLDAANALATLHIPTGALDKMGQVTDFEDRLLRAQSAVADRFSKEQLIKMYDFGQTAQLGVGYFADGVASLSAVAKLQAAPPDITGIDAALSNIDHIMQAIDAQSQKHTPEDVAKLGIFSQTGQQIATFVETAAGAFEKLKSQRFDLRGQINLLFDNIDHALHDMAVYSARWKVTASDAVRQIADNAGAILKDLSDALDPFSKVEAAGMVGSYEIDAAVSNVEYALGRMGKLADSPLLQGTSLTRLQQASSVLGSVFSGLKTALDTLQGLTQVADSTGTIDVGADLDQFFLDQVPAYASSWESAMTRIGNASVRAGQVVKGALGTGGGASGSQNAMASHGSPGGNTYNLNIGSVDVSKDPVIEELVKRIFAHLNLVGGGIPVGAGG
jgi:hypothetical protein